MTDHLNAKRAVRKAFDGAAQSYDGAASVQREVCDHLAALARAHGLHDAQGLLLDIGCGTGFGIHCLAAHAPDAARIALDFAPAMLRRLPADPGATALCADLEAMPIQANCMDGVWSSLALQWSTPERAFAEIARVLKPGGRAWLATLGPATFDELRRAFQRVDDARHVIDFHLPAVWAKAATAAGLGVTEIQQKRCHAWNKSLRGLLQDIRAIGAHSLGDTPRKPLSRQQWRTLEAAYEGYRQANGLLPATYDLILLALKKPDCQ